MKSPQPRSIIEPAEKNALKPTFSCRLQSRIAALSAPLSLDKRDVSGERHFFDKCGIQVSRGDHHSETVRLKEAHPAPFTEYRCLESTPVGSVFPEAG